MTYDQWKLATPPEYGGPQYEDDQPFETWEEAVDAAAREIREERDRYRQLYQQAIADTNAAVEWVREYERLHGPLKSEPRLPDFMVIF